MKALTYLKKAIGLVWLFALVLSFLFPDLHELLFGSAYALAIVGTPAGEIDTDSTDQDRVVRDVSSKITEHRPDVFRVDTALRKLPSSSLHNVKAEWEEVDQYPRIANADNGADIPASAAGDPTTIPLSVTADGIKEASYFIKSDVCRVIDESTNTDHANFIGTRLFVLSKDVDANTITVKAFDSTGFLSQVPAIPALATALDIVRVGNAKSEKEEAGETRSMQPQQFLNYVHTFEKVVSISKMRKKLKTYTENDLKRNIRQSIFDYRLDLESGFWDGIGFSGFHPETGDKMYAMKGVSSFIQTNVIALPAVGDITEDMFIDWGEQVAADSHGSEEKMLYVSPSLWSELNKINLIKDTLQTRRMERVLGGFVIRIQTGHVDLLIGVHKGFPMLGKQRYGSILDFEHIRKRVLEPMDTVPIEPEKSGGARVEGRKYIETSTVEVRYEKTHGLLV